MREILFKGKRTDNGEWVYGFLVMDKYLSVKNEEALYITKPNIIILGRIGEADYDGDGNYYKYEVAPETAGQYTGLKDKNGTKIFEGDIVKYGKTVRRVIFEQRNNTASFGVVDNGLETIPFGNYVDLRQVEVIGNIHDNPELLKGGADNA